MQGIVLWCCCYCLLLAIVCDGCIRWFMHAPALRMGGASPVSGLSMCVFCSTIGVSFTCRSRVWRALGMCLPHICIFPTHMCIKKNVACALAPSTCGYSMQCHAQNMGIQFADWGAQMSGRWMYAATAVSGRIKLH